MSSLAPLSLPALLGVFTIAALIVWWSGKRLPAVAATIGERTGLGQAFAGMLLLGGITTLPELATTTSASALGAPDLALNNLLGSAAFNVLLLAIADFALGPRALTSAIARPATLLQGTLGLLLLAGTTAAILAGDQAVGPVGIGSTALFAACIGAMWLAAQYATKPAWQVVNPPENGGKAEDEEGYPGNPWLALAGLAALILAGGVLLSQTADLIADRTGLGSGLVGFLLLAAATSLPELTAITAAVRSGRCELAVGDIFGANLFNVAMIFIIDLVSPGRPVLATAGRFEALASLLALILTGLFVVGLIERRDKAVLRMGYDSLAAVIIYGIGVILLMNVAQ